jgi:hypothetical protein
MNVNNKSEIQMKMLLRAVALIVPGLLLCAPASATPTLTLSPATIAEAPGSATGWGFTITNDANYIEITSAQFCLNPVAFPACDAPVQGTFTDFISAFNDIVVGHSGGTLPGSISQSFDALLFTGIGSFSFLPGTTVGASDAGQIVLTYNVFDADPNGAAPANQIGFDQVLVANTTATVSANTNAVPEPTSAILIGAGILTLAVRRRR